MTSPQETSPSWQNGWWQHARHCVSPNFGVRPANAWVDLAVIHSISLPPGQYGGPEIERLFTNQLDWQAHPYFQTIEGLEVSSHFVIRRDGQTDQYVSVLDRAWHAGASHWRGRDNCNDDSVGIELEGLEGDPFELAQYTALAVLLRSLSHRLPIQYVAGHEHIAPGRKNDPGKGFNWSQLKANLHDLPLIWP
jgi:N-acetyl-anhydromuramoyl-L-alanine amidase